MNTLQYKLYLLLESKDQYIVNAFGSKLAPVWGLDVNDKETIQAKVNEIIMPLDPTSNKANAVWIARLIATGKLKEEDYYKIPEALTWFTKVKPKLEKRDIMQYADLPELHTAIKPFETGEVSAKSGKQEAKSVRQTYIDKGEAEVFYKGKDATIIIPKTKAASCEFGRGTRWCTAANSNNQFASYNKNGTLYIIYSKAKGAPHQMHVRNDNTYRSPFYLANNADRTSSVNELYAQIPEAVSTIFKSYESNALKTKEGKKSLSQLGLFIEYFAKYTTTDKLTKDQIELIRQEAENGPEIFKSLLARHPQAFVFKGPKYFGDSEHAELPIFQMIFMNGKNSYNDYDTVTKNLKRFFSDPVDVVKMIINGEEINKWDRDEEGVNAYVIYAAMRNYLEPRDNSYISRRYETIGMRWAMNQIEEQTPIGKKFDKVFADIIKKDKEPDFFDDYAVSGSWTLIHKDNYKRLAHSEAFRRILEILNTEEAQAAIKLGLNKQYKRLVRELTSWAYNSDTINSYNRMAQSYMPGTPLLPNNKKEFLEFANSAAAQKTKDPAGVYKFPSGRIYPMVFSLTDEIDDNAPPDVQDERDRIETEHNKRVDAFKKQEKLPKAVKIKNGMLLFGNTYSLLIDQSKPYAQQVKLLNTSDVLSKAGEALKAAMERNLEGIAKRPTDSIDDVTFESYKQKLKNLLRN